MRRSAQQRSALVTPLLALVLAGFAAAGSVVVAHAGSDDNYGNQRKELLRDEQKRADQRKKLLRDGQKYADRRKETLRDEQKRADHRKELLRR